LGAQFPGKKLDEDIEFEMDFLKGNAFRNLTPFDVKRLGSARPGNVDADTVGQGSRALVRINKTKDQLSVTWGNAPDEKCLVDFVLDAKNQANSKGYTNLKLACVVGAAVDKTAQK
jgi:hypothetical protein